MKVTLLLCLLSIAYIATADEYDIIQSEEDETAPSGVDAMGDTVCDDFMCVSVTRKGDQMEYVLESQSKEPLGWMAVGFGRIMAHTPMIMMWANVDRSVTLSQRTAPREQEPEVVKDPPFRAVPSRTNTLLKDERPRLAFNIPAIPDEHQDIIWAFGRNRPDSLKTDAHVPIHVKHGHATLNLNRTFSPPEDVVEPVDPPFGYPPLQPYQRTIVAHAVFSMAGYLVILPAGALVARYMRTFSASWMSFHWIIQGVFSGSMVLFGLLTGRRAVEKSGGVHYDDSHKKFGLVLFLGFILQAGLGALVHRKPYSKKIGGRLHACSGLVVIILAFYQARTGYKYEWSYVTGRPAIVYLRKTWYILIIAVPVLYAMGLTLLPRQLALARMKSRDLDGETLGMESLPLRQKEDGEEDEDEEVAVESKS